MPLNFYLGATTGLTDGTLEVAGDNEGLHLPTKNTPYVVHIRASDSMENAEAFDIPAPDGGEVSKDGTTWASSVTFNAGEVGDTNSPVYFQRLEAAGNAFNIVRLATTPRLATVTERAEPTAPAAFTPTVSNVTASGCRVSFGTTDVNGDTLTYKVAVTESATPPEDWSGYDDVTSPHDVTGLSASTTYYAHVRAYDGALATVGTSAPFTTGAAADTTPPTLTGALTATAQAGQVVLDWPDATDNVGVAGYDVEYGTTNAYGTAVSPDPTVSAATVTGLTNGILHYFRVRAYDAAGNTSAWLTATATPQAAVAMAGTLAVASSGFNAILSGLTATATSPATIARFEARHKLSTDPEYGAASTLFTPYAAATSAAMPHSLRSNIGSVAGDYHIQVRAVDSAGGTSDWQTVQVYMDYSALPMSGDFSTLSTGETIQNHNGWHIDKSTANTAACTAVKGTQNSLAGAVISNGAPVTSPATSANILVRKVLTVDVTTATYIETTLTPTAPTNELETLNIVSDTGSTLIAIRYSAGILSCYNGSTYVTLKSGLTGNIALRVEPIYNTNNADVYCNGEYLGRVTVWRTITQKLGGIYIAMNLAIAEDKLNTVITTGVGNVTIARV